MEFNFSHGRTALKCGLRWLKLGAGDELLVPAYICDVVTNVLAEMGIVPKFYPVLPELQPDWDALHDLVGDRTAGVLAVHYFGQPQNLARFQSFCSTHGLLLIEDNAHGYGGRLQGRLLGTFGDMGISSPRKTMGWRNGGILHWNGKADAFPDLAEQPGRWRWKAKSSVKKLLCRDRVICNSFRGMPDYHSQEIGREAPVPAWRMDAEYQAWLKVADIDAIATGRRAVWRVWERWARQRGLQPVFTDLSPEASPLAFAVRTASAEESRTWFEWGWKGRLYVHSWPALPRSVVEGDADTMALWKTVVCFSIDAAMSPERLSAKLGI